MRFANDALPSALLLPLLHASDVSLRVYPADDGEVTALL